ncbi:MAG: hypothetical protein H5U40_08670 [Polyangiaceae bacterium]|nr:hypothetical protein [Polyangiaceae bacterium]
MRAPLVALVALLSLTQTVRARDGTENIIEIARPEAHASFGGHGDIGVGLRLDLPIIRSGLLESSLLDELSLSAGIDIQFVDATTSEQDPDDVSVIPSLALQWSFYPAGSVSYFAELGFSVVLAKDDHFYHEETPDRNVHTDLLLAVGARIHRGERFGFIARVGWPVGVQLGVFF